MSSLHSAARRRPPHRAGARLRCLLAFASFAACSAPLALAAPAAPAAAAPGTLGGPARLDLLQDAQISPDGSGGWLLTGTIATIGPDGAASADYNRGAPLWRSRDLKTWTGGDYAWDRVEHYAREQRQAWSDWGVPEGRIGGYMAQATTRPSLHRVDGKWLLLFAMNQKAVFIVQSKGDRPDGPYAHFAHLTTRGGHPALFTDDDGARYLVLADGWIARFQPDLKELAEPVRPLALADTSPRLTFGGEGLALFKRDGRYHLLAPRRSVRDGRPVHDAVLWTADNVYGPYAETSVVLPETGPVTVFKDSSGAWLAVSSQRCSAQGPRIVPIPAANR